MTFKKWLKLVLPAAVLTAPFLTDFEYKKVWQEEPNMAFVHQAVAHVPVLHTATSLSDSIPLHVLEQLGLAKITGEKFTSRAGLHTSYFKYQIKNRKDFILALSNLPFSKYSVVADTTADKINFNEVKTLEKHSSSMEESASSSFWNADDAGFEAYQCIKGPFRHIVLLSKTNPTVIHRIERYV